MAGTLPQQEIAFRLGSLSDYPAASTQSSGQLAQPLGAPPRAQGSSGAAREEGFLAPVLQLLAGYLLDADVGVIRATQSTLRHAPVQQDVLRPLPCVTGTVCSELTFMVAPARSRTSQ